jgi:tryptophanyl-tRNA synthetase
MENSNEYDYVTEKVYDALAAGCVPIYYGAPNIGNYIPAASSIVDYSRLGSAAALLAELERLAANQTAYEEKLAWKSWSVAQMSQGDR